MRQKLTAYLLGAGLGLASGLAVAKEYSVEIIVFDRLGKDISTTEQWDFSSARIAEGVAEMAALADKASEHKTVGEVFTLEPVRLNLLESGYRILNTTSWRQPTSFYQHAPLIPLGDADTALAAGFVRIYTTSLIHADLHLQLSPPPTANPDLTDTDSVAGADADARAPQPHYFIAEKRRLKFTQVHYFDHPLFGAILGVWEADG